MVTKVFFPSYCNLCCQLKKITTVVARYEWINVGWAPGDSFPSHHRFILHLKKNEFTTGFLMTIFSLGFPSVPPAQPVAVLFLCKVKDCYLYKVEQERGGIPWEDKTNPHHGHTPPPALFPRTFQQMSGESEFSQLSLPCSDTLRSV